MLVILALDWAAMLFAETILKWIGTTHQVFAVVLGVTQVALGLQVMMHSLSMLAFSPNVGTDSEGDDAPVGRRD